MVGTTTTGSESFGLPTPLAFINEVLRVFSGAGSASALCSALPGSRVPLCFQRLAQRQLHDARGPPRVDACARCVLRRGTGGVCVCVRGEEGARSTSMKHRQLFQEAAKSPPSYVNKDDSSQGRCRGGRRGSGWRLPAWGRRLPPGPGAAERGQPGPRRAALPWGGR